MKKNAYLLLLAALLISACATRPTRTALSSNTEPSSTPLPASTGTPTALPIASETEQPTNTPTPTATPAPPMVTLTRTITCRMGPGETYYKVYGFFEDVTAEVTGRNQAGTWVLIKENPSGNDNPECWVPVSAIEKFDGLETLSVADYEPLPLGPTSITATNGVCGSNKPMIVSWSPVVDGMEYQLFRSGTAIASQTGGKFYDVNLPDSHKGKAQTFTYMVQSFNDYGTSPSVAVSVSVCGKEKP